MIWNRLVGRFILSIFMVSTLAWGKASSSEKHAEAVQGRFPLDHIISISSGYFRNTDSQDLLVTHEVDTLKISTGFRFRTGHYILRRQSLLRFSRGKFEIYWQSPPYIARSSPSACIYSPAWCHGNFDGDPLEELAELDNGSAFVCDFDQGAFTRKRMESGEGAIDQAIGWNFDGKGGDEILALKYFWDESDEKKEGPGRPRIHKRPETDCRPLPNGGYRISVLTLSSGNIKGIWSGDFDEIPSATPIGSSTLFGKMILDGNGNGGSNPILNPILREPQSDVSGSRYVLISKAKEGNAVEVQRPFPVEGNVLPMGDLTFLGHIQRGVMVHGSFLKVEKFSRISKTVGIFRNGKWTASDRCEKEFPGTLVKFAIGKNQDGWIHVHEGKFRFWPELPDCEE